MRERQYRYTVYPVPGGGFKTQVFRRRGPFWVLHAEGLVFAKSLVAAQRAVVERINNVEAKRLRGSRR